MFQPLRERSAPLALVGVLFGLLIIMSAQVTSGEATLLERTVFQMMSPVVHLFSGTVSGVRDLWTHYVDLRGARRDGEILQRRLDVLNLERLRFDEVLRENGRLREFLQLQQRVEFPSTLAKILANDSQAAQRTLILDRGSRDGVRLDMPVLAPSGVVGRIVAVARRTSKVQLITDVGSGTAVRVARTRLQGLVRGRGPDDLRLEWVPQLEDVRPGDRLVTSGLDRVHPPGFPVGTVLRVLGGPGPMMLIDVAPAVSPAHLEEVLVLKVDQDRDPRFDAASPPAEP